MDVWMLITIAMHMVLVPRIITSFTAFSDKEDNVRYRSQKCWFLFKTQAQVPILVVFGSSFNFTLIMSHTLMKLEIAELEQETKSTNLWSSKPAGFIGSC